MSGKPTFAAWENISKIGIDNPHIADGGATIFNPFKSQIIHSTYLESENIHHLLDSLPKNTYVNLFTTKNYYLQNDSKNDFSEKYSGFLKQEPELVKDIKEIADREDIVKINVVAFDKEEKEAIEKSIKESNGEFNYSWSSAPALLPVKAMVVTNKKVSKRSGVKYLADYLKVDLENVLGVGDTIHDWDFIEICGYKGVMGNGTEELKEKLDKTDQRHFIGGHINEDGIIDIFKKFNLI